MKAVFDLQPTLEGALVRLRPLEPDDFTSLCAVASDPLIWEQHPERDRYREDVFRNFFRSGLESGGAFVVEDKKNGQVIGSSRFAHFNPDLSEIEIGWTFLARSHWGGHFNREMKTLMLQHAFQFVTSVVFVIGAKNLRSRRAIEKIGAVLVRAEQEPDGRESVVYRITGI